MNTVAIVLKAAAMYRAEERKYELRDGRLFDPVHWQVVRVTGYGRYQVQVVVEGIAIEPAARALNRLAKKRATIVFLRYLAKHGIIL